MIRTLLVAFLKGRINQKAQTKLAQTQTNNQFCFKSYHPTSFLLFNIQKITHPINITINWNYIYYNYSKSIIMLSQPQRNMLYMQKQLKQNTKLTQSNYIRRQQLKISFPLLSQVSLKTNRQNINAYIYKCTAVLVLVSALLILSQGYIAFLNMLIILYLSFFIGKLLGAQRVDQQNANTYKNEEEPKSVGEFFSKILFLILVLPIIQGLGYGVGYLFLILSFVTAGLAVIASTYLRIFLMLLTLALSIASGKIFIHNQSMLQTVKQGKMPGTFGNKNN